MDTKILKGEEAIKIGSEIINDGGLVVFPTETVYGLGANAFNEEAVSNIFKVKGRPQDNPLIVHVSDKATICEVAREVSAEAKKIIDEYMPGPITIILKKNNKIPNIVTANGDTVGIRLPESETAREFIRSCQVPIAAPSANTSSKISPTTAQHVFDDLNGKIELIIDGGPCKVGIESTIIDLTTDVPTVLRPGAITDQMLAKTLGTVKTFKGEVLVAKAPGMKYKHYAPSCPMVLSENTTKILEKYDNLVNKGENPIIMCAGENKGLYEGRRYVSLGDTDDEMMRNVYGTLHLCEKIATYILCEDLGTIGKRGSIMNRLNKSSGGKKI